MLLRYRTLWISDLHLGTRASRAADLLDFLSKIATERIYLVGDRLDRNACRAYAESRSWERSTRQFVSHLTDCRNPEVARTIEREHA